uniref:Uncharacterized protein n=1 Tax=Arundo donax TaxID=35708 RepID=A0A0A9ATT1_ARUDO
MGHPLPQSPRLTRRHLAAAIPTRSRRVAVQRSTSGFSE